MTLPARILLPLLALLLAALAACGGGEADAPSTPVETGTPSSDVSDEPGRDASPTPAAPPTATAQATEPVAPAATPTATATATEVATPTATGTATAVATPTPTPAVTEGVVGSPTPTLAGEAVPLTGALQEMLHDVATARGLDPPSDLRVRTFAADEVVEVYTGRFSEEQREALKAGGALYQLLGYVEPGETLWDVTVSTAAHVAGFYSFGDRTLWVASEEEGVDFEGLSAEERHTLAHEMVHAIQDHHFDLSETEGRVGATIDARLAWTSLIEGDATLHTATWSERRTLIPGGFSVGSLALLADLRQAADMPPAIQRAFWFPYLTGPVAVRRILEREGAEALNALFERSPPGTAAYIHTHLLGSGWSLEEGVDRLLPPEAIVASLGSGWTEEESGVLGEFHLMNYLLGDTAGYPWPAYGYEGRYYSEVEFRVERAGEGWRGDSYRLFKSGEKRALVIVVRFTDAEDAREFEEAHREALAGGQVAADSPYTFVTRDDGYVVARIAPVGRTVFFAIGTSAEVARAALAPLVEG